MKKKNGAILLVAGTCIGSGMIALPMTMSKIGIIPSIFIMFLMWGLIYYSALISLELNLQAGKAMTLGQLGAKFSGKIASFVGSSSFKILSFSLVAVYIYASTSLIQKLLEEFYLEGDFNFTNIALIYSFVSFIILSFPIKIIDYINRVLFVCLLLVIMILVLGLVTKINLTNLPLFASKYNHISSWIYVAPVVFTAFGFHGSLPMIVNYCNNNKSILKKVFLWGCFIPSVVYIIWTLSILSVVYDHNPELYANMIEGKVEVGDLVKALISIVKSKSVQLMIWWISLLAIVTSLLGVGMSLCEAISDHLNKFFQINRLRQPAAAFITVLPSCIMAIWVPNAFIKILGFAGMILVVIAIIFPIYLLKKANISKFKCEELKDPTLVNSLGLIGIIIILSEILNIIYR